VFETPFDRKAFFRVTGAALHPERESLETLKRIRATIGEDNFAGRYQQTPAPAGGGTLMADLVARETGSVCPDWMVERRGFEPMVIVVSRPQSRDFASESQRR
jgi:hypothetical protein